MTTGPHISPANWGKVTTSEERDHMTHAASGVTIREYDVTPEQAEKWLGSNSKNRNVRRRRVVGLAAAMERGEWENNGETIKIATDGQLIDGQHRLMAVVESGVTVPLLVVEGLDPSVQPTVDTGIPRNFADVLRIHGETEYSAMAAATRALFQLRTHTLGSQNYISNAQLKAVYDHELTSLRLGVTHARRLWKHIGIPRAVLAALFVIFLEIDEEDALDFFDRIEQGVDVPEGDASLALKRWVDNATGRNKMIDRAIFAAVLIKAWNAYRAGKFVSVLAWKGGGKSPEPFPVPQ